MKVIFYLLIVIEVCFSAQARTWTDKTGRSMEADLVRVEGDEVVLKKGKKEYRLSLEKLSQEDQDFIEEHEEEREPLGPGELFGTALQLGNTVTAETELSPELLKLFSKHREVPEKMVISVYLPTSFDPSKLQKVFWPASGLNNDGEWRGGDIAKMRWGGDPGQKNGWLVIAANTNLGNPKERNGPGKYDAITSFDEEVIRALTDVWPNFRQWKHASGGFSGSGKASFYRVATLLKNDCNVVGQVIGGVNQVNADFIVKEYRLKRKRKELADLKLFVSTGTKDPLVPESSLDDVLAQVKKMGYRNVRNERYEGAHGTNDAHIQEAMKWFVE